MQPSCTTIEMYYNRNVLQSSYTAIELLYCTRFVLQPGCTAIEFYNRVVQQSSCTTGLYCNQVVQQVSCTAIKFYCNRDVQLSCTKCVGTMQTPPLAAFHNRWNCTCLNVLSFNKLMRMQNSFRHTNDCICAQ